MVSEEAHIIQLALEKVQIPNNDWISISYLHSWEKWNWNIFFMDDIYSFQVTIDIIRNDNNPKS